MKITFLKWGAVSLALLVSAASATTLLAQDQSSSPSVPTPAQEPEKKADPSIAQRKENQQDRIANGVKSGQLTPGETANLENKEAAINKETRTDRAAKINRTASRRASRAASSLLVKPLSSKNNSKASTST